LSNFPFKVGDELEFRTDTSSIVFKCVVNEITDENWQMTWINKDGTEHSKGLLRKKCGYIKYFTHVTKLSKVLK